MKKELKSGIFSADKSADCLSTVGGVNVIAVLRKPLKNMKPHVLFTCENLVPIIHICEILYQFSRPIKLRTSS